MAEPEPRCEACGAPARAVTLHHTPTGKTRNAAKYCCNCLGCMKPHKEHYIEAVNSTQEAAHVN